MFNLTTKTALSNSIAITIFIAGMQLSHADSQTDDTAAATEAPLSEAISTETTEADSDKKGNVSIEFRVTGTETETEDDDDVKIILKKDGVELSEEETDEELDDWEAEVLETLDEVFRGNQRKGIFALQQDRDSGFMELGFGLKSSDGETMMREGFEGLEFATEFNAGLQVSGLFFEYFSASPNRGLFGLNFFNNEWLGLDMIIGKEHQNFADDKEDTLLIDIDVRHADLTGGVRSTVYLGPLVVQGQVRKEITKYHEGYTGSVQAGTSVQIKNLNLHAVVGAS